MARTDGTGEGKLLLAEWLDQLATQIYPTRELKVLNISNVLVIRMRGFGAEMSRSTGKAPSALVVEENDAPPNNVSAVM